MRMQLSAWRKRLIPAVARESLCPRDRDTSATRSVERLRGLVRYGCPAQGRGRRFGQSEGDRREMSSPTRGNRRRTRGLPADNDISRCPAASVSTRTITRVRRFDEWRPAPAHTPSPAEPDHPPNFWLLQATEQRATGTAASAGSPPEADAMACSFEVLAVSAAPDDPRPHWPHEFVALNRRARETDCRILRVVQTDQCLAARPHHRCHGSTDASRWPIHQHLFDGSDLLAPIWQQTRTHGRTTTAGQPCRGRLPDYDPSGFKLPILEADEHQRHAVVAALTTLAGGLTIFRPYSDVRAPGPRRLIQRLGHLWNTEPKPLPQRHGGMPQRVRPHARFTLARHGRPPT